VSASNACCSVYVINCVINIQMSSVELKLEPALQVNNGKLATVRKYQQRLLFSLCR
jgi:hypothetical protein